MNNKKIYNFTLFFIIFLTFFWFWFFFSEYSNKTKQINEDINKKETIVESITNSFIKKDLDLELFWQVYNLILNNYYSSDNIDKINLQYEITKWLVNWLWDKFSEYMTPEMTKEFEDVLNWDFEWIWAVIEKHDFWIIIDRVLKWSPALNYWILKWDIVVEANWVNLKDLTVSEAVKHIKWPAWTKVTLKIIRQWESDFLIKEVIRDKIKIPSVDTKNLEDEQIGYISINMFWQNTRKEFKELLDTFNNEKVKWIIIDLRDNWWWYLQTAVEILSNFIEKNKLLVTVKYKDSLLNSSYFSKNNWNIFDKKIVVLLNWNSRSASEIMAWALKDYKKAIIVWEKSYWKWSVQQPFPLKDWSMLKLTIAKWYTPNDYSIDWNWILPDIEVLFKKEDYEKKYDRQLEKSKEILKEFIKLDNIWLVIDKFTKDISNTWSLNE